MLQFICCNYIEVILQKKLSERIFLLFLARHTHTKQNLPIITVQANEQSLCIMPTKLDSEWKCSCSCAWLHLPPLIEYFVTGKGSYGGKMYEMATEQIFQQFQCYTSFNKMLSPHPVKSPSLQ